MALNFEVYAEGLNLRSKYQATTSYQTTYGMSTYARRWLERLFFNDGDLDEIIKCYYIITDSTRALQYSLLLYSLIST